MGRNREQNQNEQNTQIPALRRLTELFDLSSQDLYEFWKKYCLYSTQLDNDYTALTKVLIECKSESSGNKILQCFAVLALNTLTKEMIEDIEQRKLFE